MISSERAKAADPPDAHPAHCRDGLRGRGRLRAIWFFSIGGMTATCLGAQPGFRGGALLERLRGDRIVVGWVSWGLVRGACLWDWRGQVATGATPCSPRATSRSSPLANEPHLLGLQARFSVGGHRHVTGRLVIEIYRYTIIMWLDGTLKCFLLPDPPGRYYVWPVYTFLSPRRGCFNATSQPFI